MSLNRLPRRLARRAFARHPALATFAARLDHRRREALAYLFDWTKPLPSNQVRALIFGQGRTGSTLLESLICSTGHFRENGEPLRTKKGEILAPLRYVRGLAKWQPGNFICHVKIYQLTRDRKRPIDPAGFVRALSEAGWKVIYLRRENKLKHVLSNFVAEHRGAYQKYDDVVEDRRITVDCANFSSRMRERLRFEEAERAILADIPFHEVIYEADLERADSHQRTVDRILAYLALAPRAATSRHRKVNTQPLTQLIVNHEEFVECVRQNGWQQYL